MAVKLNPDGKGVWDDVEKPEKVAKLNPDEEPAGSKTQPRFKPKVGSVIPAKRRLVKRMMFDWFVRSISGRPSVPQFNTTSGCSKKFSPPNSSNDKKVCPVSLFVGVR
ncbi:uncharacterized protein LOC132185968 [Corylus avellana]|uniref:uncharacterized protein LOC132185968 n=1 Tax=Corylus avellana TaxID=13451 RepID=UPI00286C3D66|nr:uncharacterized protein LOC132185968 [Corylus avellana]